MTKINHFTPASEEGHFNGLVDEGNNLRQSWLYKQILPRPVRRSFSEGGTPSRPITICINPVNLVKKTSCLSVFVAKTQRNLFTPLETCLLFLMGRNPRNLWLIKDLCLYNCRDTFTDVMGALQIHLFMQNKAKFRKVKSNVNKVFTRDYDHLDTWSIRKKQSQTNPNKAKSNPTCSEPVESILANKTTIRTQFKPKQTQFLRQKYAAFDDSTDREVVDKQMLSWYCSARKVPQYFIEVDMENTAKDKSRGKTMAKTDGPAVFNVDRPFDGKTLKKVVSDAGYNETALAETLGLSCVHESQDFELIDRRVRADSPYNILVRLFWLGRQVSEPDIRRNLPGLDIEQLEGIGLLIRQNGTIRSIVKLGPYHELLMACDFEPGIHGQLSADHVLGVSAASLSLANVTIRRKVKTALDLGTGAGIQAFLAAHHAARVIGTDTNPRALNFAKFNAKLNEIDNVEWLQGSLYEPVAEQKFELIVSNPPFVISPESRFIFRDTNLPGDALSEQVMCGVGERLTEGGFGCILFNWHHKDEEDWDSRPKSWTSNTGCDGWLISFKSTDPLTYAADWLQTSVGQNSPDYGRYLDEWMAYYEQMGIRQISAGAMVMRRRSGRHNWFRSHILDKGRCMGSSGDQIERIFAAEDLLQSLDDDRQLLEQRLLFDEHHLLRHELRAEDGRWAVRSEHLYASEGVPFAGNVDMYVANLLAGCDGKRTLRELLEKVAARVKTDPQNIVPTCLNVVKNLMRSGFLSATGSPCTPKS